MPSSMNKFEILKLILEEIKLENNSILWLSGAILLETYGRLLGSYDFYLKNEKHAIWSVATTTKDYIPEPTNSNPVITGSSISAIHRIKLWSDIKQQFDVQISQINSEAMSISELVSPYSQPKIMQESTIPPSSLIYLIKEKQKGLKEKNV